MSLRDVAVVVERGSQMDRHYPNRGRVVLTLRTIAYDENQGWAEQFLDIGPLLDS